MKQLLRAVLVRIGSYITHTVAITLLWFGKLKRRWEMSKFTQYYDKDSEGSRAQSEKGNE